MFISSYQSTTAACRITDTENLIRLQRSLKGKALEAVQSRLMVPSAVPGVIKTLRLMFGRPELVIQTLIQKVRSEPAPKPISFAMSVQNLCGTMEASGLQSHLCNPMLLQELTDKLPDEIKWSWAIIKTTTETANLSTFSNWLSQMAEAASNVTGLSRDSAPESKKETRSVILSELKALDRRGRWQRVQADKLCRRCFGKHHVHKCESTKIFGTDGCTAIHHPLLHNDSPGKPTTPKATCNAHRTSAASSELYPSLYMVRQSLWTPSRS